MSALTDDDERELLTAVKQAVALVDKQMSPNEALEKIARERKFDDGRIRILAAAYNTGRQTQQRCSKTSTLDKLASFPLADSSAIIDNIYGSGQTKAASAVVVSSDYSRPPSGRLLQTPEGERVKSASSATGPVSLLPAGAKIVDPRVSHEKATRKFAAAGARQQNSAAELRSDASRLVDEIRTKVAGLVRYFKIGQDRLPFSVVQQSTELHLGKEASALLDVVYAQGHLTEKRAAAAVQTRPADINAAPFTTLRECVKLAKRACDLRKRAEILEKGAAEERKAARPFVEAGETGHDKEAFLGSPMVGAAVGGMFAKSLGAGMPKDKDKMVDDAYMKLEDPSHQNELRRIRAQTLLAGMMSDPDDPISGYDPDTILQAYNEISQLAPRTAEQPAAIKPLLRRHLASHTEPFEAKEIGDIEKSIASTRQTPRGGSLIPETSNPFN